MGRPPKKQREPGKRNVSLVELKAQFSLLSQQTDRIRMAVDTLQRLEVPAVGVRGPARIQRGIYTINGYLSDLAAATTRLELENGGSPNGAG